MLKQRISLAIGTLIIGLSVACAPGSSEPTTVIARSSDDSATATPAIVEATEPPEFDVDSFAAINPNPEIRELDTKIDLGFYERERLPRDAIEPIYTPKFVTPDESTLSPDEIVIGLVINGDARAYPIGLLRAREMVNDEVGGTPVLVSW